MGYNAIAAEKTEFVSLFAAFWADVLEVIDKLVNNIEDEEKTKAIVLSDVGVLKKRLQWLYGKIPKLVYGKDDEENIDKNDEIDKILKSLDK